MNLAQKIKLLRQKKEWTQTDLAKMSGISLQSIKMYETNKNNGITSTNLHKLANALNVDMDFLLDNTNQSQEHQIFTKNLDNGSPIRYKKFVNGSSMVRQSENLSLSGSPMVRHSKNVPKSTQSTQLITIMHYKGIKASAGYGVENAELDAIPIETTKDFLRSFFKLTSFSNLEIITVYGDSMLPYLQDGETILIQRTSEVKNNQIIIIRVENDIYVKRYIKEPFTSTIKLISENKNYDDITITSEQFQSIQIIGVVCGSFRLR